MEQPGVNAPGTAKMSTLPEPQSDSVETSLAGVSSKRSAFGIASPT